MVCDRKMNVKIKGKVYRTVVRPVLMYGVDTWALKKTHGGVCHRICIDLTYNW